MKKFQFRLEQVLQQRVAKEEQTLLEQVKAQQECLNCRQSLEETHYKLLELRREATVKARQERMVLEKLKEKQWNQYKQQEAYLESKEIDELATLGYARAHH